MDVRAKPLDDVNVRLALTHSLNREEIVEMVFLGHGQPGNDIPIAPTVKFAIDPQLRHVYEPEKAKAFLRKAGLDMLSLERPADRRLDDDHDLCGGSGLERHVLDQSALQRASPRGAFRN